MSDQADFWSSVADRYDAVVDAQIGGGIRTLVRDRVAAERQLGRVVEFGCGTGFYTEVLAPRASSLLATDLSPGMLALARQRVRAANVAFQVEDCQRASLPDGEADTAFLSLVLHFTEPERTIAEMCRILRPGGVLLIANLDPQAMRPIDRLVSLLRVVYHGVLGYRVKPPKRLGRNVLAEAQLRDLLAAAGFVVDSVWTATDPARRFSIPVEYVRATKN
jgi:ubiquinone/menaquinone biosynthesis C-methylase UbiE